MRAWFQRHPLAWIPLCYFGLFYLPGFFLLERIVEPRYLIHCFLDDWIPFCEYFLIPYALWFPLLAGAQIYFLLKSDRDFLRLCFLMFTGMTICLVIYLLLPNGLDLRPVLTRDNLFCQLVTLLRRVDTPTNVCPSIHVFVSVTLAIAMARSPAMAQHQRLRAALMVLCGLICLTTMFLKQHSVIDVACGGALSAVMDLLASPGRVSGMFQRLRRKKKKPALES